MFHNISKQLRIYIQSNSPFQFLYFINHKIQIQMERILISKIPKNVYLKTAFLHISKLMS